MTFWYINRNGLNFFKLFKLYFHLGLITTPHVHMTYVKSFSYVSSFTRSHGQEKSLSYYDLLYDFRSSTLQTHPHPHFLRLPPQPHHPYTPHLCQSTTVLPGEGYHPAATYSLEEDPSCIEEDFLHSRLDTAKVERVLTGGEGAWKPTKISWVHCRLWLKVPATYPPITDWVHSKCSCRFQVEHMMWVHLCNILNVILTCTIHLIPHNS